MNIAVVCGGISPERNVSITGGLSVCQALKALGHNVSLIDPALGVNCICNEADLKIVNTYPSQEELNSYKTKYLIDSINSAAFDNIDVAFLVLHGINGEDGKVQSLLELRGIPYTGSKIMASSVAIDKQQSKILFNAGGILTPAWTTISPKNYNNLEVFKEIRSELGEHIVIKPNDQGSTIGISIIENGNLDDIHNAVLLASKFSKKVLIEEFIPGRELTVGIIGGEALPVIEIVTNEGYYDYEHKYNKGRTEYICPANISDDIAEFAQNLALSAYNIIGCEGFARADFRLDEDGQAYCLEINTIPGFTSTSLVPKAAAAIGIEFPELCERIINYALNGE